MFRYRLVLGDKLAVVIAENKNEAISLVSLEDARINGLPVECSPGENFTDNPWARAEYELLEENLDQNEARIVEHNFNDQNQ